MAPMVGDIIMVPTLQMEKLKHTALWNLPLFPQMENTLCFCIHQFAPVDSTNFVSMVPTNTKPLAFQILSAHYHKHYLILATQ